MDETQNDDVDETIEQKIEQFILETQSGKTAKVKSVATHRLERLVEDTEIATFGDLTSSTAEKWIGSLEDAGWAKSTTLGYYGIGKEFYDWLRMNGHVEANPFDDVEISKKRNKSTPTSDVDFKKLRATAIKMIASESINDVRTGAQWLFMLHTGALMGDVRQLRYDEVTTALESRTTEDGKTVYPLTLGAAGRDVVLPKQVMDGLTRYMEMRPKPHEMELMDIGRADRTDEQVMALEAFWLAGMPRGNKVREQMMSVDGFRQAYQNVAEQAGVTENSSAICVRHAAIIKVWERYGIFVTAVQFGIEPIAVLNFVGDSWPKGEPRGTVSALFL